jgi:hypothetical protein
MQLIVCMEPDSVLERTDVLEASAKAVIAVLNDPRALPGGEWHPLIARWLEGRIRKLARRARGSMWVKAQEFPGVTVTSGTASVRALTPMPTDATPKIISKLQLSGMTAAAAGHAAQIALMEAPAHVLEAWARSGWELNVIQPEPEAWDLLIKQAQVHVVDAGFTEVPSGAMTAVAYWL